jgi:hypothetical protein
MASREGLVPVPDIAAHRTAMPLFIHEVWLIMPMNFRGGNLRLMECVFYRNSLPNGNP